MLPDNESVPDPVPNDQMLEHARFAAQLAEQLAAMAATKPELAAMAALAADQARILRQQAEADAAGREQVKRIQARLGRDPEMAALRREGDEMIAHHDAELAQLARQHRERMRICLRAITRRNRSTAALPRCGQVVAARPRDRRRQVVHSSGGDGDAGSDDSDRDSHLDHAPAAASASGFFVFIGEVRQ